MTKELEALEIIKDKLRGFHLADILNIMMVEKALKALEIIKKKQVQVDWFIHCAKNYGVEGLDYYNNGYVSSVLTQEEFDLLKKVLL